MSPYLVVLPNSPLLLHAFEKNQFLETKKSFQKVRDELRKRGITKVVTVASSPKFERSSFSVYTHPTYQLSFAEFGDLITKNTVPIWWEAYNCIQSPPYFSPPVELIDSDDIDYGHAVPIQLLESLRQPAEKIEYFAINDFHTSSKTQRHNLGKHLLTSLQKQNEPFAILFFGAFHQTISAKMIKPTQIKNTDLRQQICEGNFDFQPDLSSKDLLYASIPQVLEIAAGMYEETIPVSELSFEKDERTCFFAAELL